MVRPKFSIGLVVAVLALIGSAGPAAAVNLWATNAVGTGTGGSVTVGGLTITATSCTAKVGGINLTSPLGGCGVLNLQLIVSSTAGQRPEIEILGASNGSIFSTATTITAADGSHISEGAGLNDLTLRLTITSTTKTVDNIGAVLTGSDTGANRTNAELANISMSESYASANPLEGASLPSLNLSMLAAGIYSGSVSSYIGVPLPTGGFTVTKDIRLAPPTNITGDVLVLSNVRQRYHEAPEPASLALLAVGLGGLVAIRRRGRHR